MTPWLSLTGPELLETSYRCDIGRVRPNNEDSLLALPPWREPALTAGICLFVVSDGMGGHASGEVASRMAVESLRKWLAGSPNRAFSPDALEAAVMETNHLIFERSSSEDKLRGMGTTMSALMIQGTQALIGHVGDSRVYLLRDGNLKQLTRDHTLVGEQVRLGKITPEDARKHPTRHILTRAMGVREFVSMDVETIDLQPNDIFFLCSDGIYGLLNESEIRATLLENPFATVADRMVDKANNAGGTDNSSAIAIQVKEIPVLFPQPYSFRRLHAAWKDWWRA
jgi:protein phosphatase